MKFLEYIGCVCPKKYITETLLANINFIRYLAQTLLGTGP